MQYATWKTQFVCGLKSLFNYELDFDEVNESALHEQFERIPETPDDAALGIGIHMGLTRVLH